MNELVRISYIIKHANLYALLTVFKEILIPYIYKLTDI